MPYNPFKEFYSDGSLAELPFVIIEREPRDTGEDWEYHHLLIESVLRHYDEVADCSVDIDGQMVYVNLESNVYNNETTIEELRRAIGRVTCFNYIK
jgi:hypothetical protein